MNRRAFLATLAGATTAGVAGCLDGEEETPEVEVKQFAQTQETPIWARAKGYTDPGAVMLLDDPDHAERELRWEEVDSNRRDDIESFLNDWDTDEQFCAFVETPVPDTGYEIEAGETQRRDATVIAEAGAEPTTGGDGNHAYASALLRITPVEHGVENVYVNLANGWADSTHLEAIAPHEAREPHATDVHGVNTSDYTAALSVQVDLDDSRGTETVVSSTYDVQPESEMRVGSFRALEGELSVTAVNDIEGEEAEATFNLGAEDPLREIEVVVADGGVPTIDFVHYEKPS